jgi:peptide-methionine (S)-S-oxide reductase
MINRPTTLSSPVAQSCHQALRTIMALVVFAVLGGISQPALSETTPTQTRSTTKMTREFATFGAGCFWGVESVFMETSGVLSTAVGYAGGDVPNPTYKMVCTGTTNHAEVVQVEFDPSIVSYETLVELFFRLHDPTQVNRQGPDIGTQYRSVIFTHSPEQDQVARAIKERLDASGVMPRPIATQIQSAPQFWKAEEYHQQYFQKRGLPSCHAGNPYLRD